MLVISAVAVVDLSSERYGFRESEVIGTEDDEALVPTFGFNESNVFVIPTITEASKIQQSYF